MPYLKIDYSTLKMDIEFKDKYIFLQGDSGIGKSYITELLTNNEIIKHYVKSDLDIRILNKYTKDDFDTWSNLLIIADEVYAKRFINRFYSKECYILIISRHPFTNINFSYRCLYIGIKDTDGVMTVNKQYNLDFNYLSKYDCIITEDSGYAYDFIKYLLPSITVISSGGKSNIVNKIKELESSYESCLLICDGGGIGSDIRKILERVALEKSKGKVIDILMPECFEQVLLCSNYFNYDEDIFKYFELRYNDTETFCEREIHLLTAGTELLCNHAKNYLSECWYKECNDCPKDCPKRIDYSKLEYVLESGPLKVLLQMRQVCDSKTPILDSIFGSINNFK